MALLGPVAIFLLGMLTVIVAILIFYFAARSNKSAADLYRSTVCAGID